MCSNCSVYDSDEDAENEPYENKEYCPYCKICGIYDFNKYEDIIIDRTEKPFMCSESNINSAVSLVLV